MKQYRILKAGDVLQKGDEWMPNHGIGIWIKTNFVGYVVNENTYRRAAPFNYKKCPIRDICSVPTRDINCGECERCKQVWKRLGKWFKNNSPA
jgi:hypothetical protein